MFLKLIFLCLAAGAMADDWCTYYPSGHAYPSSLRWCTYGCCNEYTTYDPCCNGLSTGTIVGIIIGGIVFCIIVAVAIILGRRRYHRTTTVQYAYPGSSTGVSSTTVINNSQTQSHTGFPQGYQPGYPQQGYGPSQAAPPYPAAGQNYKTF